MTEAKAGQVPGLLARPDPAIRLWCLFGPDSGLARERADALMAKMLGDDPDPFQIVRLDGSALGDDPARIADEAQQIGMFGGERVIRVADGAQAGAVRAIETYLENPAGAAVIVEAGDIRPDNRLRKLCAGSPAAMAIACYAEEGFQLERLIDEAVHAAGLRIEPDARALLAERLGPDRRMNRNMIEVLLLYRGDSAGPIQVADVEAALGDSSTVGFDAVAFAALGGDARQALLLFDKTIAEKLPAALVTASLLRQFDRFDLLDSGRNIKALRLGPPSREAAFRQMHGNWAGRRRAMARSLVIEADIRMRSDGLDDALVCRDLLLRLASAARRAGRG